jgi:hypothetical protein
MARGVPLVLLLVPVFAAPLAAQAPAPNAPEQLTEPAPPGQPKTMVGSWEFSNADREKTCTVTFQSEAGKVGK